jgi:hypothetical protein
MALEPFSSGADQSGASGVGGYAAGTGPASSSTGGLNPAFGRSSRDLASDSGPAAAPQGLWTTPGTDTETTAGDGPTANPDAATNRRPDAGHRGAPGAAARKTDPDVDPDTRLGLHPTTSRMVAPELPNYPETGPRSRAATGAVAGVIGAAAVVATAYLLHAAGLIPAPPSLAAASRVVANGGHSALAYVAGAFASIAAGVAWGALFGLLVRRPTIVRGMAFGLLPALFQCLVLAPLAGQGVFFSRVGPAAGTAFTLLFNVLLFGGALGYFCGRWLRPPYTGAVDPDVTTAVRNP